MTKEELEVEVERLREMLESRERADGKSTFFMDLVPGSPWRAIVTGPRERENDIVKMVVNYWRVIEILARAESQKDKPTSDFREILPIALKLHSDFTGSYPEAYADWNGGENALIGDLAYLKLRLENWREPSSEFDLAVKNVLIATLKERDMFDTLVQW